MRLGKIILLSCLTWLAGWPAFAYVMSSSHYLIEQDSVNVGGLDNSSSTNYLLKDTLGEIATGDSSGDNFNIHAGYRQMDEVYLAISAPESVALTPAIGGVTGGTANGNGTWNVKTDSPAGYNLSLRATSTPALVSGEHSFADYTPAAVGAPDYTWDLAGADSEFGFSPFNAQSQIVKYKNDGASCATGDSIIDGACWNGLTTANEQIVNRASRTDITGEDTKINFRAQVSGLQAAGIYSATAVATAVAN